MTKKQIKQMHAAYEDRISLQNEIYDILKTPEYEQWFIRTLAEMLAKVIIISRGVRKDEAEE